MTLRYQSWRWFTRAGAVLAIPAVAVFVLQPGPVFEIVACVYIFGIGASGALVAILLRTGGLRFTYTDADRRSFEYRLSSMVRHMEDREQKDGPREA